MSVEALRSNSKYEVIKSLGKGSMGKVFLVKKNNSFFALKESPNTNFFEKSNKGKTFSNEAKLLSNIVHPGLPDFYDCFELGTNNYILMEYIEGSSLEDILNEEKGPLREKDVLNWGIHLCEILFYLHTLKPQPVIYRDLKPSNIIITDEGLARLIDFGVSRRYNPGKDRDTERLGTPGYAAPEQYRKKAQSTPRSDIYALGVVLFQLLTFYDPSDTPFRLPSLRKLNPLISEELEWIIGKAMNLDPRDRYLDSALFMEELVDYYEEKFGPYNSPYRKKLPYLRSDRKFFRDLMLNFYSILFRPFLWIIALLYSIWSTSSFLEKTSLITATISFILYWFLADGSMSTYLLFLSLGNLLGFLASRYRIF